MAAAQGRDIQHPSLTADEDVFVEVVHQKIPAPVHIAFLLMEQAPGHPEPAEAQCIQDPTHWTKVMAQIHPVDPHGLRPSVPDRFLRVLRRHGFWKGAGNMVSVAGQFIQGHAEQLGDGLQIFDVRQPLVRFPFCHGRPGHMDGICQLLLGHPGPIPGGFDLFCNAHEIISSPLRGV